MDGQYRPQSCAGSDPVSATEQTVSRSSQARWKDSMDWYGQEQEYPEMFLKGGEEK